MNGAVNNGGPAFPCTQYTNGISPSGHSEGLSLRDYFAAKAMQGMLAVPDDQRYGDRADKTLSVEQWQTWAVTGVVEHAYRVADAMLKAREGSAT